MTVVGIADDGGQLKRLMLDEPSFGLAPVIRAYPGISMIDECCGLLTLGGCDPIGPHE